MDGARPLARQRTTGGQAPMERRVVDLADSHLHALPRYRARAVSARSSYVGQNSRYLASSPGKRQDTVIEKLIHIVWVGDDSKRPQLCIDSWKLQNPTYEVRVWGNADLMTTRWINARHIKDMWSSELCGVADLMRYEILYNHGGFAVDADSLCIRPLEDWLFSTGDFACWSNEHSLPGMVANGYMATERESPLAGQIIADLSESPDVVDRRAWQSTGPILLTQTWHRYNLPLTVWPSYFFIPEHHSGPAYTGSGPVFARQLYATTRDAYERITSMSKENLDQELDSLRR